MSARYFNLVAAAILLQLGITGVMAEGMKISNNKIDWAALNPDLKGATFVRSSTECLECHEEYIRTFSLTKMGMALPNGGCESCHGPMSKHLDAPRQKPALVVSQKNLPPDQGNAICTACHESGVQLYWQMSEHATADNMCTDCHNIMSVEDPVRIRTSQAKVCFTCHKEQRTDSRKISHHPIREGKAICTDCHNPHGSAGPSLLTKSSVNETCFTCHAEKRGPLLWEHEPVTEDCTYCHTPHGSNITPLLKSRTPFLCSECHDGPHHSADPAGPNVAGFQVGTSASENYTGRACMNCHSMVHGSNHPAGALLQR